MSTSNAPRDHQGIDALEVAGATPLTPDELEDLIPSYLVTRDELNAAEQQNISRALTSSRWRRRFEPLQLLDDLVARDLHKDPFGEVWRWAGRYRRTERNIGVDPTRVALDVRSLMENARYWFAPDSTMPVDEAGAMFHHRLVQIHPFPNGNGRHSRAMTDLLLQSAGIDRFTWGRVSLVESGQTRGWYMSALHAADGGNYGPLNEFVRS
ncbi:mobile mystery protein B [Angustibacter sp. McL0619]|uniref:mobile mystery protein B n=1 Tax=Angustibacter sp. McL0619 TaxID=3415676 RepID=UPI003CECD67A